MNITTDVQAGGARSLPAEMKVWPPNAMMRMRAQHPVNVRAANNRHIMLVPPPTVRGKRVGFDGGPVHPPGYVTALSGLGVGPNVFGAEVWRRRQRHAGFAGLGGCTTDPVDGSQICTPDPEPSDWVNPVTIDSTGGVSISQLGLDAASEQSLGQQMPSNWGGPVTVPIGKATPAPPSGYQWAQLVNAAGNSITQVLAATRPGTSYTQLPNGTKIVYSQNPGYAVTPAGGVSLTSTGLNLGGVQISSGMLMLAGAGLLVFMMSRR